MLLAQLTDPTAEALAAFLTTHLHGGRSLVQVSGEAEVTYQGRAASFAEAGAYLVMVKSDGSVQVHGPKGIKPVNWQPKTDEVTAAVMDGECVLTAYRAKPEEVVQVRFTEPAVALALALHDRAGFVLKGSERDMQRTLAAHPEVIEPGLSVLDRELLVGVGGIDLYARDAQGRYVVVELKRGKAGHAGVAQVDRYVRAVREQLPHAEVRGILAAPDITVPALKRLEELGLTFVRVTALPEPDVTPDMVGLF